MSLHSISLLLALPGQNMVVEMQQSDFRDFKDTANRFRNFTLDSEGNQVRWIDLNEIRVNKANPNIVLFKYWHSDTEYHSFDLDYRVRGPTSKVIVPPPALYDSPRPITEDKFKDLNGLVKKGQIPLSYSDFYMSLPHTGKPSPELNKSCTDDNSESDS